MAKETAEGRARALIADSGACSSEESLELSSGDVVGLANLISSHDRLLRACEQALYHLSRDLVRFPAPRSNICCTLKEAIAKAKPA